MINGIGPTGGRLDASRVTGGQRTAPVGAASPANAAEGAVTSPAAVLAEAGPPVDAERIKAVRALIAEGRYKIDPNAIAAKMIEMDLAEQVAQKK